MRWPATITQCRTLSRSANSIAPAKTCLVSLLLARDETALAAKRVRLAVPEPFRGFAGTVSEATDLIGRYHDAGAQLVISSAYKNDAETLELLASDVIPRFS